MKHVPFAILFILVRGITGTFAQAPSASDSTLVNEALQEYQERIRYGFLLDPFSVYSSTYGFGIRGVATLYNLPFTGSRLRASAQPSQRRGLYGLSLRTHDPDQTNVFGLFRIRFETTSAYRYYGIGPGSQEDDKLLVDMDRIELLARIGFQFFEDRLMVQPVAYYLLTEAHGVAEGDDPTVLDARSLVNLALALGEYPGPSGTIGNRRSGLKIGVSALADLRDRRAYPTGGFLLEATAMRYLSQNDFDVSFDELKLDGHIFVGLGGEHVLAFRALAETTRNRGEDPIPFYLLPEVDFTVLGGYKGHRFVDDDLFVATAEYRWPVANLADLYQVSGFIQAGVGNVYDNLADMKLSVSFDRGLDPNDPVLRPGFGIGFRVAALEQGRDLISWMLGFSPEGVTLASFRFVVPLIDI